MLGLPQNSDILKQLPKRAIYAKFNLSNADRQKFDNDVSKLFIVNELSTKTINIQDGKKVSSIYVVLVELKTENYNEKNITLIAKLIPQNLIFILRYEEQACLAVYYSERLLKSSWQKLEDIELKISGLNLDIVFENFIKQIGGIVVEQDETLDSQLELNDTRQRLEREIAQLSKKIANEKQPHKKFELMEQRGKVRKSLKETR